ncbi:hypothetical protein AnigIFM59636_008124 [Aspergillus niger]|nr:hypothetical protein AnigIFM59636_008124 [Aspergillus niger]
MTTHSSSPFHLRPAKSTPTDHAFILSAFDSSLPLLASIGSHEQWGSTPFSQRGDFPQETLKELDQSEEYRLTGKSNMDSLRIFIVEREYHHDDEEHTESLSSHLRVTSDGQCFLPVGFAYVRENWIPKYYEQQGFRAVGDWSHTRANNVPWLGTLMCMDI